MTRIALVDDDRNIMTSLSMTLEAEGFDVRKYTDGQTALQAFEKKMPDLAVIDINMPRMNGIDLLQRLRQKSTMPAIFLSSKAEEIDEVLGLRIGADDYVKKPFSPRLIVERIRAVLRRHEILAKGNAGENDKATVMVRGPLCIDQPCHTVTWSGKEVPLTVTEFLLVQALALRPGHVKSREQLMDIAYNDQVYVDDRTIDSHIKRIRAKMRMIDDEFTGIETIYGVGYRFNQPEAKAA